MFDNFDLKGIPTRFWKPCRIARCFRLKYLISELLKKQIYNETTILHLHTKPSRPNL